MQGKPFCWSKMGTESGESLNRIIRRKEFERKANEGGFLWGVGNSVMPAMSEELDRNSSLSVFFSVMKSKPKEMDIRPDHIVLWTAAEDYLGNQIRIPNFSMVISRGSASASRTKSAHYALYCHSETALSIEQDEFVIDASRLRNSRSGNPIGASQVTSVVYECDANDAIKSRKEYAVQFSARLLKPGQLRLTNPQQVAQKDLLPIERALDNNSFHDWIDAVQTFKERHIGSANKRPVSNISPSDLFSPHYA